MQMQNAMQIISCLMLCGVKIDPRDFVARQKCNVVQAAEFFVENTEFILFEGK